MMETAALSRRTMTRRLVSLGASSAVLAALGPFGTFLDFGFAGRLAYWGGLILVGGLIFEATIHLAMRWFLGRGYDWRVAVAVTMAVMSVVQTGIVAVVDGVSRGHGLISETPLPLLYFYVLLITILVSAWPLYAEMKARGYLEAPPTPAPPTPAQATSVSMPESGSAGRFLARIPGHLTGPLLALEMEDHYLRIHTTAGSTLILMRLRDAVEELADAGGMQVHRSFWVAAEAVARSERDPRGRVTLVLTNGLRVPVSRARLAAVRSAGWLRDDGNG